MRADTTATRIEGGEAGVAEIRPPADIFVTDEGVVLAVEMPGADANTLSVSVDEDVLTVKALRRNLLEKKNVVRRETRDGEYVRAFRLSRDLARNGLSAEYRQGILRVSIPRAEHTIPRRIEVQVES